MLLVGNDDEGRWTIEPGGPEVVRTTAVTAGMAARSHRRCRAALRRTPTRHWEHGDELSRPRQARRRPTSASSPSSGSPRRQSGRWTTTPTCCAACITDELLLIDAAAEPDVLLDLVGATPLATVVTTHRHRDHWDALEAVVGATRARTVAGADDADGIPVATDRPVSDGDIVEVGQLPTAGHPPGRHTPGSIAWSTTTRPGPAPVDRRLASSPAAWARHQARGFTSLMDDLERSSSTSCPDETWVYPGHGNDTTLGAERPHLGEWRDRGW